MRLDASKPSDKRKITKLLKVWTTSGALKTVEEKDEKRNLRTYVVVGEPAND
jgi:hypothetical protein